MKLSLTSDKVQLIYINPNDTYYGEDLFELDITQNLWIQLHELDYDSVYFLTPCSTGFKILNYGDKECAKFTKQGLLGKLKVTRDPKAEYEYDPSAKDFKTVVLPEIIKKKSALIAAVEDMEKVMSGEWKDCFDVLLNSIQSKSTLFVLVTSSSEKKIMSKRVLPVFQGTPIFPLLQSYKDDSSESIRDILFENHVRNCNFFDEMDEEDIRNILINIMMKDSNKFDDIDCIDDMVSYLRIILDRETPLDRNLVLKNKVSNRQDCYFHHMNMENWKRMKQFCSRVRYDKIFESTFSEAMLSHVMYNGETVGSIVEEIRDFIKRKKENDQTHRINFCIIDIIQEWDVYSKDYETIGLVFSAIRTYLQFLTVDELGIDDMRVLFKSLEIYKYIFQLSKGVYLTTTSLESTSLNSSGMTAKVLSQSQARIYGDKKEIELKMDALTARALQLMNKSFMAKDKRQILSDPTEDVISTIQRNDQDLVDRHFELDNHENNISDIKSDVYINNINIPAPEESVSQEQLIYNDGQVESAPSSAPVEEKPAVRPVNLDDYDFDINDIDEIY